VRFAIAVTRLALAAALAIALVLGMSLPAARAAGGWTETALHEFSNGPDSAKPSSGLIADSAGNLYGETLGAYDPCPDSPPARAPIGIRAICGSIYELSPPTHAGGAWTETVLYAFTGRDGTCCPGGGLTRDRAGNLYGSMGDGLSGAGDIFELSPTPSGPWVRTTLHRLRAADGSAPSGSMILDARGALYGVATLGGAQNGGTVFRLSPPAAPHTAWRYEALYSFVNNGPNGFFPVGNLAFDSGGALYGATTFGGTPSAYCPSGCGVVYRLIPSRDGRTWTQQVLVRFDGFTDGALPFDGVVLDAASHVYGTDEVGEEGGAAPQGSVFRLTPPQSGNGTWTEALLYAFGQTPNDAGYPHAGVRFDGAGNLFGTTQAGNGTAALGAVFRLTPPADGSLPWDETIVHAFSGPPDGDYPQFAVLLGGDGPFTTTENGGDSQNCPSNLPGCGAAYHFSLPDSMRASAHAFDARLPTRAAPVAPPPNAFTAMSAVRSGHSMLGTRSVGRTARSASPGMALLSYHGGPIVPAANVYITFWHYDFGDPYGVGARLQSFVGAVGGSAWLATVTQYYGAAQGHITNPAHVLAGVWKDNVTHIALRPSVADIEAEANRSAAHFGGVDPNGIYLIALPRHHDPPGFGAGGGYCAYNDFSGTVPLIGFPYVLDAPNDGYACGAGAVNTPGRLDGVSIVAGAEIASAITNPNPASESGWFAFGGDDISALCEWTQLRDTYFGALVFPTQPLYSDAAARCVQRYP
jgi:serine protease